MSYQSDNFQRIKDLVIKVDKCADFRVDFNTNKLQISTNSNNVNKQILDALEYINIFPYTDVSTEKTIFNIEL